MDGKPCGMGPELAAPLARLMTSDSIPVPAHERLSVVRTAPHIAHAVRQLLPGPGEAAWATVW